MSDTIRDGTGTGNRAKVDDHGRLWVSANVIDHKQHHALYHKNMYIVTFNTTLPDANPTVLAFFKNLDGSKDFEIYDVEVSSDANVELNWYFGDEYTSGGTAVEPINTNRGSGATLGVNTALAYEGGSAGDLLMTTTDRELFHKMWLGAYDAHSEGFDGSLIFTNNTTASMTATGVTGDEISVTVYLAWHDAGTEL
ncbi:MAG: hypothetical protein ABFS03_00890 [Chloroflexota bacterium]